MGDKLYLIRKTGASIPWETYTPSGDSRIVYCDSTRPDDSGDGLSEGAAKKTLSAAKALLRNGYPDWLKLKRGCTWANESLGSISISGQDATNRLVFSTYGSGARPVVDSRDASGLYIGDSSYICVEGIKFYASRRDPNSPNWSESCLHNATGINCVLNPGHYITIQDCDIGWYPGNIIAGASVTGDASNIRIIGNSIHDSWTDGTWRSNLYQNHVSDSLIEGNTFYRSAWSPDVMAIHDPPWGEPSVYNHGFYITYSIDTAFRNNVCISPSNGSLKMRSDQSHGIYGLVIEYNLFCGGGYTCHMTTESVPDTYAHYNMTQRYNLHCWTGFDHGMGAGYQSWGSGGNAVELVDVHDEIFFNKDSDPAWSNNRAWMLNSSPGDFSAAAKDVHIHDCIVHDWYTTLTPKIADVASDPAINIVIENNTIDQADNYWVDANRTLGTYNIYTGGTGGTEAERVANFASRCLAQTRQSWNSQLEARNVYAYIKAGFTPV